MLFLNAKNCWQQIHKPTIVQHNDRDLSKKSGFPFPSGFRDFEKTNQTEQTVNRKKSGFRTAPEMPIESTKIKQPKIRAVRNPDFLLFTVCSV